MIHLRPLTLTRAANAIVATIIAVVPFHAFFTVWAASFVGHYTLLRPWPELLLVVLFGIVGMWLVQDKELRQSFFAGQLIRLLLLYGALTILLGAIAYLKHEVTLKALGYGLVVNLRFLLFFAAVHIVARRSSWLARMWPRLVLVPAAIVSFFATLQYVVLPNDFLRHFGYSEATISPTETINNNAAYIRVQSTLRGANPLGAYLIIVLSTVVSLWTLRKRWILAALGAFAGVALLCTFSRSAWAGAALAVAVAVWLQLKSKKAKQVVGAVGIGLTVVAAAGFLLLRDSGAIQNAVFHTDNHSTVAVSSNDAHDTAFRGGLKDVAHEPFGRGTGTAGPASVYNGVHDRRIAENYYLQIAQEIGWVGLLLFVLILLLTGRELYRRSRVSPLSLALFASLVGVSFVNLLSHAWVDVTLAYVWWGLAGIALSVPISDKPQRKQSVA